MSGIKGANAGSKHYRFIHGETKTRLFKIWSSMHERCERVKHPYYDAYGGRGMIADWIEQLQKIEEIYADRLGKPIYKTIGEIWEILE